MTTIRPDRLKRYFRALAIRRPRVLSALTLSALAVGACGEPNYASPDAAPFPAIENIALVIQNEYECIDADSQTKGTCRDYRIDFTVVNHSDSDRGLVDLALKHVACPLSRKCLSSLPVSSPPCEPIVGIDAGASLPMWIQSGPVTRDGYTDAFWSCPSFSFSPGEARTGPFQSPFAPPIGSNIELRVMLTDHEYNIETLRQIVRFE